MSQREPFFPSDELKAFLVTDLLRPEIDALLERGIRLEAQTVFVAGNNQKLGPKLGAVLRGIPIHVEVMCYSTFMNVTDVICKARMPGTTHRSKAELEWDLKATVRKDEKGFYLQGLIRTHQPQP